MKTRARQVISSKRVLLKANEKKEKKISDSQQVGGKEKIRIKNTENLLVGRNRYHII